jgi:hypothetical protein
MAFEGLWIIYLWYGLYLWVPGYSTNNHVRLHGGRVQQQVLS